MRQDKFSKAHLILYACGIIPVVWLALLLAPYLSSGLVDLVRNGGVALEHPFHIIRKPQFMLTGSTLTDLQMMIISLVAILPAIPAIVSTWT